MNAVCSLAQHTVMLVLSNVRVTLGNLAQKTSSEGGFVKHHPFPLPIWRGANTLKFLW